MLHAGVEEVRHCKKPLQAAMALHETEQDEKRGSFQRDSPVCSAGFLGDVSRYGDKRTKSTALPELFFIFPLTIQFLECIFKTAIAAIHNISTKGRLAGTDRTILEAQSQKMRLGFLLFVMSISLQLFDYLDSRPCHVTLVTRYTVIRVIARRKSRCSLSPIRTSRNSPRPICSRS